MEASPIIVSMDVHCLPCARMISGCLIKTFVSGVHRVVASHRMDMVLVYGGAGLDPSALKRFLQLLGEARHPSHGGGASTRRVGVLSDGGRLVHVAPPPAAYPLLPFHAYPPPPPPPPGYHYGAGPKSRWSSRYCPRQSIV